MTKPSRITPEKETQLMREFFQGEDIDAAAKQYLAEVDRLESPPATPAVPSPPPATPPEDDLYLPDDAAPMFEDDTDTPSSPPPRHSPTAKKDETPEEEEEQPDTPEDPEDDEDEDFIPESLKKKDQTPLDKLRTWFAERDPLHQKLIIGAVLAAVLLLIAVIVLIVSPGNKPSEEAPVASDQVVMEETAPTQQEGSLIPASANAQCAPDHSTPAQNAFDPQEDTAWVCERSFGVDGTVLEMTFSSPVEITKVGIVPGFNFAAPRGEDEWLKHRVVTRVLWRIGDEQFVQQINPARSLAEITIPTLITDTISMTVLSTDMPVPPEGVTVAPPEADTFAISSITLTGKQS